MDILNIENCTIRYQEQEAAVEHVSLSIGEKEIVSIVGESGSGKTTLIRAILGILPPGGKVTDGKILFQGKNILELDERSLQKIRGTEIAMIFQDVGASHPYRGFSVSGVNSGSSQNAEGGVPRTGEKDADKDASDRSGTCAWLLSL